MQSSISDRAVDVADEPLRKHCKNIKILLKLHKKSAENRYIYYSAPVKSIESSNCLVLKR
jgi:hypothetical protein